MSNRRFILKAVSECGTYKETLRCLTQEEADRFAATLKAEGWVVTINGAAA